MGNLKKYSIIEEELKKAEAKHPNYPEDMFRQLAIMNEEAGEATKAVLHYYYENGSLEDVKAELVQTAAMCMRMIESIDSTVEFNKMNKCFNPLVGEKGLKCEHLLEVDDTCGYQGPCSFEVSTKIKNNGSFYGVFQNDQNEKVFIARVIDTSGKTWRIDDHDESFFFALPKTFIRQASGEEIESHKNRKNV